MKPGHWLALILVLYVALGAAYSLIVPLGEAPDEVDHFLYVRYLVEQQRFPVMQPVAEENDTMEANQPPLFYLLNAVMTAPFPQTASPDLPLNACYNFTPGTAAAAGRAHFYLHDWAEQHFFDASFLAFRVARLLSVVMGTVTVGLAYVLARQMAPARPSVWLLAAGLLAFNPQFLFVTASVNNDVLMALLGAAIVATAVSAATQGGYGHFALLGILIGLGLLTKFALLALWPLAFLAVIGYRLSLVGKQSAPLHNSQFLIHNLLLVTLLPLLIAGWWYGRAYTLYGDPLAWDVHLQAKGTEVLRTSPFVLADLGDFARIHFQSYWGWFGWLKLPLPGWVYLVIGVVVVVGIIGVVLEIRDWRPRSEPTKGLEVKKGMKSLVSNLQSHHIALLFNLYAVIAIYLSLLRYIQTINWSGYQGRLAFGAAASVTALLAVGIERGWTQIQQNFAGKDQQTAPITKNPRSSASYFLIPAFFLLAVCALLFIIKPAFARPLLFWPGADKERLCLNTAVGWPIEAATWPEQTLPGDHMPVTLFGLGTGQEQPFTLDLVGVGGRVVAKTKTAVPAAANQPITHTVQLTIAADAQPARALLRLDGQDMGWLKIAPARPFTPPPDMQPVQATFANQLTLRGYTAGNGDAVTLYWQAAAPITADYTTFIHLLDEPGQVVAQADGQPQQGWYPTSVWDIGEVVADEKVLARPEAVSGSPLAPGRYRAVVGVYLLETGERLRLNNGEDVIEVFTLEVEE